MLRSIWPLVEDGNLKKWQKIADLGKNGIIGYFEMAPQVQPKCFWYLQHITNDRQLKKITGVSHQIWSHRGSTFKNKKWHKTANIASLSSGSRWAWEEPKKENNLNTISKMMDTLIQVQLYTFSYRKALIQYQKLPKIADSGGKKRKK